MSLSRDHSTKKGPSGQAPAMVPIGATVGHTGQGTPYWQLDYDRQADRWLATEHVQRGHRPSFDDEPTGREFSCDAACCQQAVRYLRAHHPGARCRQAYQGRLLYVS